MQKSESVLFPDAEDKKKLIQVALGNDQADMAIINARLLNVYTGEILEKDSVCIKEKWIAYVGDKPRKKSD